MASNNFRKVTEKVEQHDKVQEVEMYAVSDGQELAALLGASGLDDLPIQLKFGNRESLFDKKGDTLSYYDLDALPMLPQMKEDLREKFPQMVLNDKCLAERAPAVYTTAAFNAEQDIRYARNRDAARGMALAKLSEPAPVLANRAKSGTSVSGLFSGRQPAGGQKRVEDNKNIKNNNPSFKSKF